MHRTTRKHTHLDTADPPVLVAILLAAHRTGDRLLEGVARRELEQRHRIKIQFVRASHEREAMPDDQATGPAAARSEHSRSMGGA
jgi:hypothetical protein